MNPGKTKNACGHDDALREMSRDVNVSIGGDYIQWTR
jgi:hypothetical protein